MLQSIIDFLKSGNVVVYVTAALAVSEALALIPALKSNGILDGVIKGLKFIKDKVFAPKQIS